MGKEDVGKERGNKREEVQVGRKGKRNGEREGPERGRTLNSGGHHCDSCK